jgi:hypothetical protein
MELRPITDPEKVVNEEIRSCAKDGSKAVATRQYVAIENGEEVSGMSAAQRSHAGVTWSR